MHFTGKVWKFPDNVDTDAIVAGRYLYAPIEEMAAHALEIYDPSFATTVKPGDIVVAGSNFGCGSSREQAPRVLAHLGIACVVAESYARIFYRNCIAVGLPAVQVAGIDAATRGGDSIEVDLASGAVSVPASAREFRAAPIPEDMLAVLREGGVMSILKRIARERRGDPEEP